MATSGNNANFNVTIGANMDPSGVLGAVKQMQGAFNGLKLPANMTGDVLKNFNKLTESLSKFEKLASQDHFSKTDIKSLQKLQKEINSTFGELKGSLTDLSGQKFYLEADYTKIKEARQVVDQLKADIQTKLSSIKIDFSSAKGGTASLGLDTLLSRMEQGVKTSKTLNAAMSEMGNSIRAGNLSAASEQFTQIITKAKNLKGASAELLDTFKQWGLIDFSGTAKEISSMEERGRLLSQVFIKLIPIFSQDGEAVGKLSERLQEATTHTANLEKTGIENYTNSISSGIQKTEELGNVARQTGQATVEMADGMRRASDEVKQLQQSTQYFFSLRNMINLLKRGIREAVDVVKELDAAMTETAVVTNFSVGDMWKKLPEYTANANALGASVKDMYEATTLYYQQGLDTTAAMGIANETMKMARIGGLEAADATDKMTAALRGFNMELNETSAQRVNDVYSNLAAKTASNTEELGTAMQRTASIAASAGMSFEGTAAFLAQAIETTREPAENLGTAMKTIVARFTELKKNPLEITEVDGEEVDYNKVDTALKSIGVSLKDTNGQFRNLDQVFLDISERWDSLTQTQQRYIATTAAGSRQQSRFIAMMSNYERTMQLMDYANNSTGASSEQFGKTMESLEAKINKLKNAWNEFLMNIMNDSWTKGIVDGTTKVLNIVTTLIDKLSFGQKGIKSVLSLFTAFTALKLTGRGANALIGGLGGLIDPNSSVREGLTGGALGGQAAKISSPIVKAIYSLIPHIDKAATGVYKNQGYSTKENYTGARTDIKTLLGGQSKFGSGFGEGNGKYAINDIRSIINYRDLNDKQVGALLAKSPGLKRNLSNGLAEVFQQAGMAPKVAKGLAKGVTKGSVGLEEALIQSGAGKSFEAKMAELTASGGEAAAEGFRRSAINELKQNGTIDKIKAEATARENKALQQGQEFNKGAYLKQQINQALNKKAYDINPELAALLGQERTLTTAEKAANAFGAVGGALSSAGMSLQMFGSQLSTVNPLLGEATMKLGGMLSAAGALPNMISSIVAGGPAVWAVTAAVTALGAAFAYAQHQEQKIKDAAQKVTDNFEQTSKKTQDNISKLKQYRSELATLSKGVDVNGNNVSLSDTDYQRYLEIVDDIAAINPKIVDGYNEQGHAIIRNNKALAETLSMQEELQDKALKAYLDPEKGLQKLIDARNIDKNFTKSGTTLTAENVGPSGYTGVKRVVAAPMTNEVRKVAQELEKADWFDESQLEAFGIHSLDALKNGEGQAVKAFVKYQDQINAQLNEAAGITGNSFTEELTESFSTLGEQSDLFNEAIQPVYQNLSTQIANSPFFESIAPEFREALNSGLKDLAAQDLSGAEMSQAANNMAARFANLTTGSGKYKDALDIVEKAQESFASSLDETQYRADVQPAIDDLIRLKEEALSEGSAYGDALAEYLENQIQRISNFTTEGGANLTEALNTATDEIAAAEGALDSFNEATKKDFSTAAEGMKGIFDKTTETFKDSYGTEIQKHAEGMGDATFWTGAEALLSGKEIERLTKGKDGYEAAEAVKKSIEGLEPMLREGKEGFDAFTDRVLENADAMDKLAEAGVEYDKETGLITNIPDDQWHNVAEALNISDDLLASMINKGRQFAEISFMNVEDARKALAASDYTIKGTSAAPGEQQNLYVKEETLRAELANAGYVRKEQQDEQIAKLLDEGVKTIPSDANQLGSKELESMAKDWGIKTLPDLIETLNETGEFSKDEIKGYADKLGLLGSEERYDSIYDSIITAAQNPELAKQTDLLGQINAQVAALRDNRTGTEAKSEYDKFHNELYGGDGHDTGAQLFGDGLNKEGKQLTAGEYEQTKKDLEESAQAAREQAAIAKERAKTETGLEKERWENIAKYYDQDADYIDTLLDRGAKAFEKNQKEIDKQIEANESKRKGRQKENEEQDKIRKRGEKKANESYEQRKFGNADDITRGSINWGADPTKNSNYSAAHSWGWNASDLQNSSSTYMSAGITVGQGKNAVELTVTPMLQTPNGPQVLNENTVNDYFNKLVSQATDSNGKVNIDKLFELDKEGLEIEGQQINNLLMGAFTGTGAREASNTLSELEHKLEESKNKAKELKRTTAQLDRQNQRTQASTPKKSETPSPQAVKESRDTGREQERKIKTTFEVEGKEELDDAENKVDTLSIAASSPFGIYLQTHDSELAESLGLVKQVEEEVDSADPNIIIKGDASDVISAGANAASAIAAVPSKHNTNFTATDNVSSKLSSIGTKIAEIARKAANISLGGSGATGHNNVLPISHIPTFASAARGKGKVGPKNKGGLTLTGEKGFEVAWLPSENRSTILGVGGPQMVNLPSDAVVYTHEQSKDILKRKGIPAGSHADMSAKKSSYKKTYGVTTTTTTTTTTPKGTDKHKDTKKDKDTHKDTKKILKKVGKITVWWENMARRIEATERLAEKNQKKYEKYLAQMKATLYTTGTKGGGNDYIKNLNHEIALYKKEVKRANTALNKYDKSTKKKDKVTLYKDKKGNPVKASLSKYISKKDGTYVLNEDAINRVQSSKRRKAIKDAATKKIDDYLSKKYKAEDGIAKAKEELEKFGEQLYETFFAWEISLNEIWDLTQRIEAAQGKITRTDTMSNLLDAQIKSGMIKADENTAASGIELFKQRLKEQNNIVAERSQAITEAQKAVQNAYSTDDEQKQLEVIQGKLQKDKEARDKRAEAKKRVDDAKQKLANKKKLKSQKKDLQKELKEAKTKKQRNAIQKKINKINKKLKNYRSDAALKTAIETAQNTYDTVKKQTSGSLLSATQKAGYTEAKEQIKAREEAIAKSQKYGKFTRNADGTFSVDFDSDKLEQDKLAGLISEEQAKFIEEYYTNLIEASKNLDETINSLGEDITEYYTSLSDLRDEWVDYEDQLIQMSEETNRKQIDNLKKLSDSVKQALDDLINDVKNKLDERRKQEDNAKTERDISRKQQRLAALRADTSGGHQVEIAQLEKEIADAQQEYQRTLEDQLLEKLQQQGDEAAKQRERQIALQEELISSINNIQQVDAWMAELSDENTSEDRKQEIKAQMLEAYRQTHDYDKKGIYGQKRIDEEFEAFYQGLTTNQKKQEELRKSIDNLKEVMDRLRVLQEQSGKTPAELAAELAKEGVDAKTMHDTYGLSYSTIKESAGYDAERFAADGVDYKGAKEAFTAHELKNVDEYAEEAEADSKNIKDTYDKFVKARGGKNSTDKFKGKIGAAGLKAQLERGRQLGYSEGKVFADLAASDGLTWEKVITAAKDANYNVSKLIAIRDSSNWSNKRKNYFGKAVNKVYKLPKKNSKGQTIQKALKTNFLTGGLADFTGPAWLDGTPSRPELVLNAKDTQNFIALKDVLANAMSGMGDTSNTYGDVLYEININVDKIEKDYDVDRVVKKVKEEITKGAGYRNVTQVRNFR